MRRFLIPQSRSEGRGSSTATLTARGIGVDFSGVTAVSAVDLRVDRGTVLGLIGPNGSGKTTLLNILSGFVKPTEGSVWMDDRNITKLDSQSRAKAGLIRTFQSVRVFGRLTVLENVELAGVGMGKKRPEARASGLLILKQLNLDHLSARLANAITAGQERKLGIARAIAADPAFLLLDEPAAGLDDVEGAALITVIRSFAKDMGCGVLLVEHDMPIVMGSCDQVQVLDSGTTVTLGAPQDVWRDERVREIYFGTATPSDA